jgi:hypothetical protein
MSGGVERTAHRSRTYEQARLMQAGGPTSRPHARTFLGAAVEVLSKGMEEEVFGGALTGFVGDADAALAAFKAMSPDEQLPLWPRFEEVRDTVRSRFRAAGMVNLSRNRQLLHDYDAVAKPPCASGGEHR